MKEDKKKWGVMDQAGNGFGRFKTEAEADARRVECETSRQESLYPDDPTAQFDTVKVHP